MWHLLRGTEQATRDLATRSYFVEVNEQTFVHTEVLLLVDEQRRIRGVFDGSLPYEVSRLIDDMHVLLRG
jgi:protein SCO1/2